MSITMRALLISELAKHMKTMPAVQARILADELTVLVSSYLRGLAQRGDVQASQLERLPSFPIETWNEITVGVPWEAYSFAHGIRKGQFMAGSTQALCSAPAQMDVSLAEQAMSSGLWGGSLLVALGGILERVRKDLIIFSPYWRTDGVRALLASAGRPSYGGVSVTVFTQPQLRMKVVDKDGLFFLVNTLRAAGAQVRVLAPRAHEGLTPNLHAKLIIADGLIAYVGSANFTKSGLDHGLEAGVWVEGETASAFSGWSKAIASTCDPWELI
jgi:phosphatidylserine/phosphatidylglycerophosphate/cardiolipin synthase-like enzyme